jgi:aminomethyltransferase
MMNVGIGLGYVTTENAAIGSTIFVDVRGKALKAEVVKVPFV